MKAGFDYIGISTPFYCTDGKGKYLFHKRSKKCRDEQGRWDSGSGEIDFGQTPEQSVLREVQEEYGCTGKIIGKLPPTALFRNHNGQKTHWIIFPFFIKVNPRNVRINEPEKIDEIGWFTLNNLPKPLHTGFLYMFKRYRKHFNDIYH